MWQMPPKWNQAQNKQDIYHVCFYFFKPQKENPSKTKILLLVDMVDGGFNRTPYQENYYQN